MLVLGLSLSECGICQRVKEMSPENQRLFFNLIGGVFTLVSIFSVLYFKFKAPLFKGIPYPPEQLPFIGCLLSLSREYHRFTTWRYESVVRTIESARQSKLRNLLKSGGDGVAIDKEVVTPTLIQWSVPFRGNPFVDILTPAGIKFMLTDTFTSFEKGEIVHDAFDELVS